MRHGFRRRVVHLSVVIGVVLTAGLAKEKKKDPNKDPEEIGNRDVGKGVNFYSLEREIALGKQMAQEVERQAKIIDDPVIAEYVNRLGQNLVRNSDAKVPFTIKVLDTDEVNAFALPGGFFFVNSGLILRADNEAELAGVMAHEIAHVAARHGTRQATRGELINYATLPLIFAGGWTGYAIYEAASAAIPLGLLKFSRVFESEADMLGLRTRPVDIDVAVRVQITYSALSAIAAELSRVPGHKNIVWVTDGVPIELGPNRSDTGDFVDFTPLLRQMSDEFDRSGVAIYPVRQIMLGTPTHIDDGPAPAPANGAAGLGSLDTLEQFAEMTGGRPDAGKDIGAAVRQAIADARTSYQVGYYPPEKNWDDKYHKLRVTCTRKGVRIQAKTGYYAWREGPGAKADEAIESTVPTTFDAAEIGLAPPCHPIREAGARCDSMRASTHKTSFWFTRGTCTTGSCDWQWSSTMQAAGRCAGR